MRVFRLTSPSHPWKLIFAETEDDAAALAVTWQQLQGINATEFTLNWEWADLLQGREAAQVHAAASWGKAGIGRYYGPEIGWAIEDPRDER